MIALATAGLARRALGLLDAVPLWAWAAAALAAVTLWQTHEARVARADRAAAIEARNVAAADAAGLRAAAADRDHQLEQARHASETHEAERARLARNLQEARRAVQQPLQQPIACPDGSAVTLADLRIPGAVLDGLRLAAGAERAASAP